MMTSAPEFLILTKVVFSSQPSASYSIKKATYSTGSPPPVEDDNPLPLQLVHGGQEHAICQLRPLRVPKDGILGRALRQRYLSRAHWQMTGQQGSFRRVEAD